jgi:pectate lyase
MAASTVSSMPIIILLAATATATAAAAATPTDAAIDEAYAHLVKVTGNQGHWAERAEEVRAYNRAEYMSDPVAVMDRFEDGGERTAAAAAVELSPSSLPRKFRAGARPPTPSTGDGGGAAATGPAGTGSAWSAGAPSASTGARPPAGSPTSSPTNRGNLQHAVVQDSSLWTTFARDMI